MPSERFSRSASKKEPPRRRFLATVVGVGSILIAGCSDVIPSRESETNDDTIEVVVENRTDEVAEIAVRVEDRNEETIFSRVFSLNSGQMASGGTIETTPSTVSVFTPDGVSDTWEYAPDLGPEFDCNEDIGVTVQRDSTVEEWYKC